MDSFDTMMDALKFNEKINQRDLEGLAELMTDDHTFIDNSGDIDKGKDVMKKVGETSSRNILITETSSPPYQSKTMLLLWSVTPPAPMSVD